MTEWRLDQDRGMPLYQQLMQLIEEKIKAGDLVPGQALPAERKLAEELQVNRSTVIRALEELTTQGILIRKRGSGTFVNPNKWGMQTRPTINWRTSLTPDNISVDTPYQRNVKQLLAQHRIAKGVDEGGLVAAWSDHAEQAGGRGGHVRTEAHGTAGPCGPFAPCGRRPARCARHCARPPGAPEHRRWRAAAARGPARAHRPRVPAARG